jgi:hypothetical protein
MVTYLPTGFGVLTLRTSTPLPVSLSPGSLNAFLVPLLDPDAGQLSSLYQIWFSGANKRPR